ncbi:MAG: cation transporter [Planctomycetaceae bacterium]|nr:cation transporter [Planctomycetaceae bacterium]
MKREMLLTLILTGLFSTIASGDEPVPTQATFLITGLHCPPCTRTVEASLLRTKGVRSVSVDWRTHNAKVAFDESQLPAQALAQRIAGTAHMMGGGMRYGGWLALKAEGTKDEKTAEAAKAALLKVPGVAKVVVYPAQESVGVLFDASGKATSTQLVDSLAEAGIKAHNLK